MAPKLFCELLLAPVGFIFGSGTCTRPHIHDKLTPEVETTLGPIRGEVRTYDGHTVHRYQGIPYAATPEGDLRFAPPQARERWAEPLEVTEPGNRCLADPNMDRLFYPSPRKAPAMAEDCLHLTVVTPEGHKPGNPELKAVMVNIHGGGLFVGSSSDNPLEALTISGDVVSVGINYRLNVFGFLATEDPSAPGNVGMLDQVMALQWIKDNIANFGGDPNLVTILGVSAGGWSVSAHAVSPLSRGLFARGYSLSGTIYGFNQDSRAERSEKTSRLAELVGCPQRGEAMLGCLRRAKAEDVFQASQQFDYLPFGIMTYGDDFLPASVKDMYDAHRVHPGLEFMLGVASEEGSWAFMCHEFDQQDTVRMAQEGITRQHPFYRFIMDEVLNHHLRIPDARTRSVVETLIHHEYFKDEENKMANLRGALDVYADVLYVAPSIGTARRMAEAGNPVLYYYTDQWPAVDIDFMPLFPKLQLVSAPELQYGSSHACDLFYAFGLGLVKEVPASLESSLPPQDKAISRSMVHAATTFAKTGRGEFLLEDKTVYEWPQYDTKEEKYLAWKYPMTTASIKKRLRSSRCDFWNTLLSSYLKVARSIEHCTV